MTNEHLGLASEARWLRFARTSLGSVFPYLPRRPGCSKRLRAALPLVKKAIRLLAGYPHTGRHAGHLGAGESERPASAR